MDDSVVEEAWLAGGCGVVKVIFHQVGHPDARCHFK